MTTVKNGSDTIYSANYDANGNMTTRNYQGITFTLVYDAENRLVGVSGGITASFTYDGDGNRVKSVIGGATTTFIGAHFEWSGSTSSMVKYYSAGGQRIALRTGSGTGTSGLVYLFSDHDASLAGASTGVSYRPSDGQTVRQLYKAWGEVRYSSGSLPTKYTFTGQYSNVSEFGLLFYNARWVDPVLGRSTSPDTIVPNPANPLDWDRYSYVRNNPLRYVDPSGHFCEMVGSNEICSADDDSNGHWLPSWTPSELVNDLWGWSIEGEWEDGAINTIVNAGFAIQSYIYKIGGNGQDWLRKYLGRAVFKRDAISKAWFFLFGSVSGGVVMANNVIRLPSGFGIDTVFHELAHVLDNHSKSGLLPATWIGGGAADAFVSAMGGNPNACFVRWKCSGTHFDNAGIDITRWPEGSYGNNGVADDFAVTFEYLLASKPGIPESRKIWMQSFLALTAKPIP